MSILFNSIRFLSYRIANNFKYSLINVASEGPGSYTNTMVHTNDFYICSKSFNAFLKRFKSFQKK